jgi:hypothetical protein
MTRTGTLSFRDSCRLKLLLRLLIVAAQTSGLRAECSSLVFCATLLHYGIVLRNSSYATDTSTVALTFCLLSDRRWN